MLSDLQAPPGGAGGGRDALRGAPGRAAAWWRVLLLFSLRVVFCKWLCLFIPGVSKALYSKVASKKKKMKA